MSLIVILLLIIVVALAAIGAFLFYYYLKINKAIDMFLEKGKIKDLRQVFFSQTEHAKQVEVQLNEAVERIKDLEHIAQISLQKVGVVRFNPFDNMGGNQSFAIAVLDSNNDGFLISSLFSNEGNRVYSKPIKNGVSEHILSEEEKEAIKRAIAR